MTTALATPTLRAPPSRTIDSLPVAEPASDGSLAGRGPLPFASAPAPSHARSIPPHRTTPESSETTSAMSNFWRAAWPSTGEVQASFTSVGGARRYPGRIRALAVATKERSPSYPDVPTFAELGYPEVDMPGWAALMAPAKTPAPIVQTLTREINEIVMLPEVKSKMAELGFDSVGWDVPRTRTFMGEQLVATRKLVASGRVKI